MQKKYFTKINCMDQTELETVSEMLYVEDSRSKNKQLAIYT